MSTVSRRVLVLWEDKYFDEWDKLLKRAVRHLDGRPIVIEKDTARCNTGYAEYLKLTWPTARGVGLPRSGPVDYLLCVADADGTRAICDEVDPAPAVDSPATAFDEWCRKVNEGWTQQLRRTTDLDPDRVFGRVFRWSKESVLTACHDEQFKDVWAKIGKVDPTKLKGFLQECKPGPPATIEDVDLVNQMRKPQDCIRSGFEAVGVEWHGKNDIKVREAIDRASREHIDVLCRRLPDLAELAKTVIELAHS